MAACATIPASCNGLLAAVSYLVIVGEIKHMILTR
jgi:hypothetical protein